MTIVHIPQVAFLLILFEVELLAQNCSMISNIIRTNSEVLVSNETDRLCLTCDDSTDTDWQLLYDNALRTLQNGETIVGIAEVINGIGIFLNPYQFLVDNQFFISCAGPFGIFSIIVYSTELFPPMISLPPVNVRKEGSLFIAMCVHLNPSLFGISITWLDQDGKEVVSNGTLIIHPLSRRNNGTFTCVLKKSETEVLTDSILLSIQYANSEYPAATSLTPGKDVKLSCEYSYDIQPLTVSWETIHQRILHGLEGVNVTTVGNRTELRIAHDSTLLINETTFACFQRDFNGEIYLPFLVGRTPDRVQELIVTFVSAFSISLSWEYQANGSSPRSGAEVEILDTSNNLTRTEAIESSATEVTLMFLMPSASYIIRIITVNRVGRSPPASINVSTLAHGSNTAGFVLSNIVLTHLIPMAGGVLLGVVVAYLSNLYCIGYKRQGFRCFSIMHREKPPTIDDKESGKVEGGIDKTDLKLQNIDHEDKPKDDNIATVDSNTDKRADDNESVHHHRRHSYHTQSSSRRHSKRSRHHRHNSSHSKGHHHKLKK